MEKRNRIASIVLFLAAIVVGFDAQPGWCHWSYLYPAYYMSQCPIDLSSYGGPEGLVVLPDGRVLVATGNGLYYFRSFPSDPTQCPGPGDGPFPLNNVPLLSLTMGLDGKVYALRGTAPFATDLVTVNGYDGTVVTVLAGVNGRGMALDPLTGDLYMTGLSSPNENTIFRYCAGCTPTLTTFATVPDQHGNTTLLDGLAWSCDGRFLFVASPFILNYSTNNQVYRFTRGPSPTYVIATLPGTHYGPDGIAAGAEGTALAGYVFSNNNDGSVTQFTNATSFGSAVTIADGGDRGDFAFVDAQGAMVAIQATANGLTLYLQRLSSQVGQWVVPGSTLCSDLGCGAKAATTVQKDQKTACLMGLDASRVLTLSQSACSNCSNCATLNKARNTLISLIDSLDPPATCLDTLKLTVQSLYHSLPCGPCPCFVCCEITELSVGPCIAKTKFPLGFDLEWYDPTLQAFMKRVLSP